MKIAKLFTIEGSNSSERDNVKTEIMQPLVELLLSDLSKMSVTTPISPLSFSGTLTAKAEQLLLNAMPGFYTVKALIFKVSSIPDYPAPSYLGGISVISKPRRIGNWKYIVAVYIY